MRAGQEKQLRLIAPNTVFTYFMKLGQKNSKVTHRANPAINFLNLTSKVTAAYPDIFERRNYTWRFYHSIAGVMFHLASSVKFWLCNRPPRATNKRCDILIVSHLTSIHQLSKGKITDYYFGHLHEALSAAGLQCHTLYINHLNSNPKFLFY